MDVKLVYLTLGGVLGTSITFLFGKWDVALTILMVVIAIDFVTGLIRAMYRGILSSYEGARGIAKKFGLIVVIIIANLADILFSDGVPVLRTFAVYFYIANEVISIFENLNEVDVLVPTFLKDKFSKVLASVNEDSKEHVNKQEDDSNKTSLR